MDKLLIIVPSLGIGGQERIAISTGRCLKDRFDVKILVFQSKEKEYKTELDVININEPAARGALGRIVVQFKRAVKITRIKKQEKIKYTYSLGATANLSNVLSKLLYNCKTYIAIHGFAEVKKGKINHFIFKNADKVVCIAKEMQYQLLRLYPNLTNTVVIENGYDIDAITGVKLNHVSDLKSPDYVAMGRLEDVKGFDRLLKAFAIVYRSNPRARLTIIGQGPKESELKNLVDELGIGSSVTFLGFLANPYGELKKRDVFVLSSRNEGFPNALIEALACRNVVVAVDCLSGPREILTDIYDTTAVEGIKFSDYGILVENTWNQERLISLLAEAMTLAVNNENDFIRYKEKGTYRASCFSEMVYKKRLIQLLCE